VIKKKSLSKLKQEAAGLLQRIVRMKAAVSIRSEYVPCFDCGRLGHWKYEMDGGHFFSRKDAGVLLVEENIHPQLKGCNLKMGRGDTKVYEGYRRHMVELYGEGFIGELEQLARTPKKFSRTELNDLISELKTLQKELEKEL